MKNEDKLEMIKILFNGNEIRNVWDDEKEEYYFSVLDIIEALVENVEPKVYWNQLKNILKEEDSEVLEKIVQFKLKAQDGKYYDADVCDTEVMFRIVESVPSEKAECIKQWLAKLAIDRINEFFDPELGLIKALEIYRAMGYDEKWISKKINEILEKNKNVQN